MLNVKVCTSVFFHGHTLLRAYLWNGLSMFLDRPLSSVSYLKPCIPVFIQILPRILCAGKPCELSWICLERLLRQLILLRGPSMANFAVALYRYENTPNHCGARFRHRLTLGHEHVVTGSKQTNKQTRT